MDTEQRGKVMLTWASILEEKPVSLLVHRGWGRDSERELERGTLRGKMSDAVPLSSAYQSDEGTRQQATAVKDQDVRGCHHPIVRRSQ